VILVWKGEKLYEVRIVIVKMECQAGPWADPRSMHCGGSLKNPNRVRSYPGRARASAKWETLEARCCLETRNNQTNTQHTQNQARDHNITTISFYLQIHCGYCSHYLSNNVRHIAALRLLLLLTVPHLKWRRSTWLNINASSTEKKTQHKSTTSTRQRATPSMPDYSVNPAEHTQHSVQTPLQDQ
jgi:hypothetical protein